MMLDGEKILVTGATGLLGSAIVDHLGSRGLPCLTPRRNELDLEKEESVNSYLETHRPGVIFHAAGQTLGASALYEKPAEIYRLISLVDFFIIEGAKKYGCKWFVYPGTTASFPESIFPLSALELGKKLPLHGQKFYGIAKLNSLFHLQAISKTNPIKFFYALFPNLFGYKQFDSPCPPVIPALIKRFHQAKESGDPFILLKGSPMTIREFAYAPDVAVNLITSVINCDNSGCHAVLGGHRLTILEIAKKIAGCFSYQGDIRFSGGEISMRLLDEYQNKIFARTPFEEAIEKTIQFYLSTCAK